MSTPVLIDCDPGVDDAIALLYALASPELDVRGVTTVAGNTSLTHATRNAARVLDLAAARADLPFVAGLAGPVARPERIPDEPIHGAGGLGGLDLPDSGRAAAEGAPEWLAAQALAAPGALTLVALGPLSNVAAMLAHRPEAGAALREIVVMGGAAHCQGNITPAAEFNFFADPEAARTVLESGLPVRIVGLDVTRAALVPLEEADRLAALPGAAAAAAGTLLRGFALRYGERFGVAAAPVHDALAVTAVADPGLLDYESGSATVECDGAVTRGALVADLRRPERTRAVRVALGVDAARFTRLLADRLAGYGAAPRPPAGT